MRTYSCSSDLVPLPETRPRMGGGDIRGRPTGGTFSESGRSGVVPDYRSPIRSHGRSGWVRMVSFLLYTRS